MAPQETKHAAEVMIAYAEGKEVEACEKSQADRWISVPNPIWQWLDWDYRIRLDPMEEAWQKHASVTPDDPNAVTVKSFFNAGWLAHAEHSMKEKS